MLVELWAQNNTRIGYKPRVRSWRRSLLFGCSLLGWIAAALSLGRAWRHVSFAWDVWYYHLPFAARLVGILPREEVSFDALNEARYEGFPRLAELAQGALWKITGRPEAANLLGWAALVICALVVARATRTSAGALVLAWLAIPVVQIHASVAYVDLPANACAAALVVLVWRARRDLAWTLVAITLAAIAVNMKILLAPLVCASLLALAIRARAYAVIALASPLVFATELWNLARFGNPAYPVVVRVLGRALPGLEEPYAEIAPRWASLPQPARFAASLLEVGLPPFGDEHRYTVDQWMPPEMDGNRMGGFLHVYVIAMLIALVLFARRSRDGRRAAIAFVGVTAIVAVMPQSHVLRYYMAWMLALVALVVVLGQRELRRAPRLGLVASAIAPLAALFVTTHATRGWHLTPDRSSFADLIASVVDRGAIPEREGARACVDKAPWSVLYAARFHPPRRYAIEIAERCDQGAVVTRPSKPDTSL